MYEALILVDNSGFYLAKTNGTFLRHCPMITPLGMVVRLLEEYFSEADELVVAGRGWQKHILLCSPEFKGSILYEKDTLFIELQSIGFDGILEAVDLIRDA